MGDPRLVTAGAVGRAHGLDGAFVVERPTHELGEGTEVRVAGTVRRIVRRAGTDRRPLVRLDGVTTREAAIALRGELLLIPEALAPGEWLAEDLIGCRVEGLGTVVRIIDLPSCDALELDDGRLVPLIADAVAGVDVQTRRIEVRPGFLGIERDDR